MLQLLVQNLNRLDEKEEADRQGVFKVLGIFESIVSLDPKYAENIALKTEALTWLLNRIQNKSFDANIAYASEILSILLQDSRGTLSINIRRKKKTHVYKDIRLKVGELDGVDILLRALSVRPFFNDLSNEDVQPCFNIGL